MKTTKYIKGTKYTNYNYYKPENSRILCKVFLVIESAVKYDITALE